MAYFWDKDIKGGTCRDLNAISYANTSMSIIQDLLIITLPIPIVVKMNMDWKKKIGVAFMFALGGLYVYFCSPTGQCDWLTDLMSGCIVSMLRLHSILVFGDSIDPSWDYVTLSLWGAAELGVAMICSCLPALRISLLRLYPRVVLYLRSLKMRTSRSKSSPCDRGLKEVVRPHFIELGDIETATLDIKWIWEERIEDV